LSGRFNQGDQIGRIFAHWAIVYCVRFFNFRSQSYDRELQRQRCKFYNATGSLARFENKIFYSTLKKALAYYNAGDIQRQVRHTTLALYVAVNKNKSKYVLAPEVAQQFCATFHHGYVINVTKRGFRLHLCDFFTSSSGHPGFNVSFKSRATFTAFTSRPEKHSSLAKKLKQQRRIMSAAALRIKTG
jgi:hypothetical protein